MKSMRFLLVILSVTGLISTMSNCSSNAPRDPILVNQPSPTAKEITDGLKRLGASADRSKCYSSVLASALDEKSLTAAAAIVREADSRQELRNRVLDSPKPVFIAFIRARFACSDSN